VVLRDRRMGLGEFRRNHALRRFYLWGCRLLRRGLGGRPDQGHHDYSAQEKYVGARCVPRSSLGTSHLPLLSCSSTLENNAVINSTVVLRLSSQGKDVTPPSVEESSDACKRNNGYAWFLWFYKYCWFVRD